MKLKQKYKPITGLFEQAFKDEDLTKDLALKHKETLKKVIQTIIDARMYCAQYGNLIQFCEENDIKLDDIEYKKTISGGFWT